MDAEIGQSVSKKKTLLTELSDRAIGREFKDKAALAIQITQCSAAVYRRLGRTYRSTISPKDQKRVKAGGLTVESIAFSARNNTQKSFDSLLTAMKSGGTVLNRSSQTSNDVAIASNQPQAINLLSLLHPVINGDIMKTGNGVEKVATILGLVATTAGFVPMGSAASSIISWVGSGATYSGFTMSRIRADAPDRAYHQLTNYISCLAAWNKKACELIDIADAGGQWSHTDIGLGFS